MDDCMAIWADRPKIFFRVHAVSFSNFCQWNSVMHVYEFSDNRPVALLHKHIANGAPVAKVRDARCASLRIAFIRIQYNTSSRALGICLVRWYFLRKDWIEATSSPFPKLLKFISD